MEATTIFHEAREFDNTCRKLRADIRIIFGTRVEDGGRLLGGFEMHAENMHNILSHTGSQPGYQSSTVKLCVSPGLLRFGNSDGTSYHRKAVLAQMGVLCEDSSPDIPKGRPLQAEQGQGASSTTTPNDQQVPKGEPQLLDEQSTAKLSGHDVALKGEPDIKSEVTDDTIDEVKHEMTDVVVTLEYREHLQNIFIARVDVAATNITQSSAVQPVPAAAADFSGPSISGPRHDRPKRKAAVEGVNQRRRKESMGEESADELAGEPISEEMNPDMSQPRKRRKNNAHGDENTERRFD